MVREASIALSISAAAQHQKFDSKETMSKGYNIFSLKGLDLMMADSTCQISREPYYNRDGAMIQFYAKEAASVSEWKCHPDGIRPGITIHRERKLGRIVGFDISLPFEVCKDINAFLDEPHPRRKKWWVTRKLHVLWVHIKWLFLDEEKERERRSDIQAIRKAQAEPGERKLYRDVRKEL